MFFNCSLVFMITMINATDVVSFARLRIIIDVWLMVLRKSGTPVSYSFAWCLINNSTQVWHNRVVAYSFVWCLIIDFVSCCVLACMLACMLACVRSRAESCMRACVRGNLWELMGPYGNLWELMGTYGNLWELYAWELMGTRGNLWELVGTYGIFVRVLWSIAGVSTLHVCATRRFFTTFFRCRAFFRCVFYTAGCFYIAYFTPQGVFSQRFLHCMAFSVVHFALQGVFRCVFYTAGCFYIARFRCMVFLHCMFLMHVVFSFRILHRRAFFVVHFTMQDVFMYVKNILHCKMHNEKRPAV